VTDRITTDLQGGVTTITIGRPERRNAMTREMVAALHAAVAEAGADDAVHAVVLTGADGVFCSGTDMSDLDEIGPTHDDLFEIMQEAGGWWPIVACPKPVIAAVDGAAIGMGAELASHCDIRIATTRARFGWNFVHRGLVPDTGAGTWLLPRQVGLLQALRLLFSGDLLRAEVAHSMGFVDKVVEPEALERAARQEAERFRDVSPLSLRLIKRLVYEGLGRGVADHLPDHIEALRTCFASDDHREGVAAFFDKRPPHFTGR
jgi:enoyl-CoA hydratase